MRREPDKIPQIPFTFDTAGGVLRSVARGAVPEALVLSGPRWYSEEVTAWHGFRRSGGTRGLEGFRRRSVDWHYKGKRIIFGASQSKSRDLKPYSGLHLGTQEVN